jgi:hypothetical protein
MTISAILRCLVEHNFHDTEEVFVCAFLTSASAQGALSQAAHLRFRCAALMYPF